MRSAIALAFIASLAIATSARQARDGRPAASPPVGTGSLMGRLVTDDRAASPIRRGRVTLSGALPGNGFTTITDDRGQFQFATLAPDRYTLSAVRAPYLTGRYGASKPGRPGVPITIAAGERVDDIVFRLVRGAAITGTIRDARGEPAPDTPVQAMQYQTRGSDRTLVRASNGPSVSSDDRGVYRLFGLTAGEYVVVATLSGGAIVPSDELRRTTAEDVRAATAGAGTAPRTSPSQTSPSYGVAPVFYPGTTVAAQATAITLGPGEERTGIDFAIDLVATGRLEGVVSDADGRPMGGVTLRLFASGVSSPMNLSSMSVTSGPNGAFAFSSVVPGDVIVLGQLTPRTTPGRGASPPAGGPPSRLWARAELSVTSGAVSRVNITMQPGRTISGTIVFDGDGSTPAAEPTRLQIGVTAIQNSRQVSLGAPSTAIEPGGAFSISGVIPGPYHFVAGLQRGVSTTTPAWTLKSVKLGDKELVDLPLVVPEGGDLGGLTLTFTTKVAELSGTLQTAAGRPASDYFVIVFPSDRAYWLLNSRRLRSIRPASDGHFVAVDVPPGEYFIAALTDVDGDEWTDPSFLERLAGAAVKVAIAEGEKKVQNLQISK